MPTYIVKIDGRQFKLKGDSPPSEQDARAAVSSRFETKLSDDEESKFQEWRKANVNPEDTGENYDFRGAFKAGLKPGEDGHWLDTYKKPTHPTFSDESIYAKGEFAKVAGHWDGETFLPPGSGPQRKLAGGTDAQIGPGQPESLLDKAKTAIFGAPERQDARDAGIAQQPNAYELAKGGATLARDTAAGTAVAMGTGAVAPYVAPAANFAFNKIASARNTGIGVTLYELYKGKDPITAIWHGAEAALGRKLMGESGGKAEVAKEAKAISKAVAPAEEVASKATVESLARGGVTAPPNATPAKLEILSGPAPRTQSELVQKLGMLYRSDTGSRNAVIEAAKNAFPDPKQYEEVMKMIKSGNSAMAGRVR